jgi:hypothetical protein
VVTAWQRAATSAYVASRRERTGPAVAAGLASVLAGACAAEQEMARLLLHGLSAGGHDVDP